MSLSRQQLLIPLLALSLASPACAQPAVERVERGSLVLENIPAIPDSLRDRLNQYQNVRSATLAGWMPESAGGGILIRTRFAETSQLHHVAEPGAARRQLTFFDEPVSAGVPHPTNPLVLYSRDTGGSEFYQFFLYGMKDGTSRMISDGEGRYGSAVWSDDGQRLAYYRTGRGTSQWSIHVMDPEKPDEAAAVLERDGLWVPTDWSPDSQRLGVLHYVSANETYPYVLDLGSGELQPVSPEDESAFYGGVLFDHSGEGVYVTSDRRTEFQTLRYIHLESGAEMQLTGHIPWNVEYVAISPDGRHLAYSINEDGYSRLKLLRIGKPGERYEPVATPELPAGVIYGLEFAPDGKRLGLVLNTPRTPGDIYSFAVGETQLKRWTFSEAGGLNTARLTVPELVRYPTFDQTAAGKTRTIPAWYYKPVGEGPFPVVVDIHGGPEAQERPYFSTTIQFLVNELGIAVLAPNVRGSAGYGKGYLKLDNGRLREDSVRDIGALLDWIAERKELNAERVAVYGGSYGGYMVLASMIHYNDRLAAGVDVVGISNFVTFLENTEDYRRGLRRVEYGDERDPQMREFLLSISPVRRADEIRKPLFIAQGLNDPRVPASESEQMVREIRDNGGEVWYLLARDEGHGFRKKSNRDFFQQATMLFFQQQLLGGDGTQP